MSAKPESKDGEGALMAITNFGDSSIDNKPSMKIPFEKPHLVAPLCSAFRLSSDNLSGISIYSADNGSGSVLARELESTETGFSSSSVVSGRALKDTWHRIWSQNRGVFLVIISQLFGALMNVGARLLETESDGHGMHTFQILFVRMSITATLSSAYMWWAEVEHFPLGAKGVRALLMFRGFGGFVGVFGLYYSLRYLPIAEAIVITFLAPTVACWVCSVLIHEPFTRNEQIAGGIALIGVVLIARPLSLFSDSSVLSIPIEDGIENGITMLNSTIPADDRELNENAVTPAQRLAAVAVALIGVLGAVISYVSIRWTGKRAHPLISVNYFAIWTAAVSLLAILFIPGIALRLPANIREWVLLLFLGVCGFIQQLLLTAGLQHEKSSRATNMVYSQMVFALAFDKIIWNTTPALASIIGSALILGSTIYVAMQNQKLNGGGKKDVVRTGDEGMGLMGSIDQEAGDVSADGLRGGVSEEVQLRSMRD